MSNFIFKKNIGFLQESDGVKFSLYEADMLYVEQREFNCWLEIIYTHYLVVASKSQKGHIVADVWVSRC